MTLAPIVLFAYNRPEHTRLTVEALQKNPLAAASILYVFSDGPKDEASAPGVRQVREYLKTVTGFKEVHIIEREENWGLAESIVTGVTEIVRKYGKIIVLEDDLDTSPYFLSFMNDALDFYKDNERVMHVSGYFFPVAVGGLETFFYSAATCWGWGTWDRAWRNFNPDASGLHEKIRRSGRIREFDIDGSYGNYSEQLSANASGRLNTWAIKWYASIFLAGGLCLHPERSLVRNAGSDGSGTNQGRSTMFDVRLSDRPVKVAAIPLEDSLAVRRLMADYFRRFKVSLARRAVSKLKRLAGMS